jgi:c-di-GMP-binding flagellar brake protein YcgR
MTSFADMNLKTGQPIQLQLTRTDHTRLYSLLIGYLAERAVIVTTPAVSLANDSYTVIDGDSFVCRAFAGRRAFAFQTDVLRVAQAPFPHLYLRYPNQVEAVVIRKATRVPFKRPVSVVRSGQDGETSGPAVLCDLSLTGAGIEGETELARPDERLDLVIPGCNDEQPEMRLKASVRKVRPVDGGQPVQRTHFGLEFVEPTPEQTRAVQELIQHQLLDEV